MQIPSLIVLVAAALGQPADVPVRAVPDPGVVTTRQSITPAGVSSTFTSRVYGVAFGRDSGEIWVLRASQVTLLDWKQNTVKLQLPLGGGAGLQGIRFDPGSAAPLISATASGNPPKARLLTIRNGRLETVAGELGSHNAGALHVAATGRLAVVPLIYDNHVAVVDLAAGRLVGRVPAGIAPFGAVVSESGESAWVSNWGGRAPGPGELSAPTGLAPQADRIWIDKRGIAASGTVTPLDLKSMRPGAPVTVGLQPTAMTWDEPRQRLYVADSNSDSISVVDTRARRVVATHRLDPFRSPVAGIAPSALAVTRDGSTLYAACGGINAVAILETATGRIRGWIPTAWYPNALSLSSDERYLAIGTLLGAGSGWREKPSARFVHAYRGSVSVVAVPDDNQLAQYTLAVLENNRMAMAGAADPRPSKTAKPVAIPRVPGEPSLIRHVVYIIKENRTYDQVFGDLSQGNGDPSLVMFGQDVAPNHRKLASEFVLLDNFYATGGNSGDGHQWVTQANQTAYPMWPGYQGRSYPFDGSDPITYSNSGFLWDAVQRVGKTVRVYGEYVPRLAIPTAERQRLLQEWQSGADFSKRWTATSPIPPLDAILARDFPAYTNSIPDVVRARLFLRDLASWEAAGSMPNLVILQLPCDHTFGTSPGVSTPKAMVADNDWALGQIVEALSRSQFWPSMAVFVVEDDAQNGVDHVDGHRTVALAISPFVRRRSTDSTFYAQQSMLKTIELILGAAPMTLFDRIAIEMRASFQDEPDTTPYVAVQPSQSLWELNPSLSALRGRARKDAEASQRMRWDLPDAAPSRLLNEILWRSVKGHREPYPGVRSAAFSPLAIDLEDEERGER